MYCTLRNVTIFYKHLTVHNFQTSRSFSSNKETLPKSIYDDLGDNSSAILHYIHKNQDFLSGQNCIEALRKLLQCYPESSRQSKQLRDKKDLFMICNVFDQRIKTLNLSQAEEAIQLLTELGISPKSIISQSLLKYIQTMKGASSEVVLQSKEYKTETDLLCTSLYKAITETSKNRTIIYLILQEIGKDSNVNLSLHNAKSIYISCSRVPEIMLPEFAHVLRRVQNILITQAHSLKFKTVLQILDGMHIALRNKNYGKEFYNEQLVDSMIDKIAVSDGVNPKSRINLLKKLEVIGHIQKPIIDYLAFQIFEDPMLLSRLEKKEVARLLKVLSCFQYKPPFWESVEQLIVDNINSELYCATDLLVIVSSLAIMGSFPHTLISRIFQLPKNVLLEEIPLLRLKRLTLLYQLVKTLHPNYTGPWPMEEFFGDKYITKHKSSPLLPALEKALGGSQYIKTKVQTKLGHLIEHVIIMRKDGFPVAFNEGRVDDDSYEKEFTQFIENIIVPPESQVITIILLEEGAYLRNSKQLRGHLRAMLTTLEALKYIVIPISLPEWENLHKSDQISFIINTIRLKCPTDFTSPNI